MTKNIRQIPQELANIHLRMEGDEPSRYVEGHAAVFNTRSVNLMPWHPTRELYEVMDAGCFDDVLQRSDVVYCYCHDTRELFGRYRNGKGTLKLSTDERGLHFECEMPNTQRANDTLELIRRGDIYGNSFCFTDDEEDAGSVTYERTDEKSADGKEIWLRKVHRCTGLYDVSTVVNPAYEQSEVSVRERTEAMSKHIEAIVEKEAQKRDTPAGDDDEAKKAAEEAARRAAEARSRKLQCMKNELDIVELEAGL